MMIELFYSFGLYFIVKKIKLIRFMEKNGGKGNKVSLRVNEQVYLFTLSKQEKTTGKGFI